MHTLPKRIKDFNAARLSDLVQLKYDLMAENMYRFYRGTCHLFYEDLAENEKNVPGSPVVWISGDLHLENFGTFKGDNRMVYFDLNDFDEAVLAPATWELVRIVTSIFIAFESLDIEQRKAQNMAELFLRSYATTLANGKAYYIEPGTAKGIVHRFLEKVSKRKETRILKKRTIKKKDRLLMMMDDPRHLELDKFLKRELMHHLNEWVIYSNDGPYNYEVVDAVFRVAGTGSVGLKRYAFLLRSLKEDEDYMLVEMKQAVASSLEPFVKVKQPEWESHAHRLVEIQRRMQNVPPALLTTTSFKDDHYLVQEMQPTKDSINFKLIKDQYRDIYKVIDDMAILTASAQLRSTGRQGSAITDDLIAFGKNEEWQKDIIEYALEYTKTIKNYYGQYLAAYKKGYFHEQKNKKASSEQ